MTITGHRTRSVFDSYNITDHSDTQEAGRVAENFLAREQEEVAQTMSQERKKLNRKEKGKSFVLFGADERT